MGFAFNPFTGTFDLTGSGGGGASYIDGEVATYADLPLDGTAALNTAWLVREASGVWPVSRKQAGIYIRTATGGSNRDADYTYAGTMPDVFSDAVLTIYDEASTTRTGQFNLGSVTAGQNRVLTWPNANGTIARTETFAAPPAIGNTTAAAANFTTVGATGIITGANATTSPPTTVDQAKGLQFASLNGTFGNTAAIYGSYPSTAALGIGIQNNSAGIIAQVAAFTSSGLALTGGTVTASAPVISATQTWNDAAVTFTGLLVNVTSTNSAAASLLANFQLGGTSVANIRRDGRVLATSFALVSGGNSGTGFGYHSASEESGHLQCVNNAGTQMWTCLASRFRLAGDLSFGRSVGLGQSPDTILVRDDAGMLAQRNAANAQTFRLYSTFTSTTNFERLNIAAQTGGSFIIGTEKGSAGGTARALEFQVDGSSYLDLNNGLVRILNNRDLTWQARCRLRPLSTTSGVLGLLDDTGGNPSVRFCFEGFTSSFPCLKRSSTTLQVRLADDSAFAPFECAGLTLNGNLTASTRNIVTDTTTGTKIGTGTTQLLGFWNATPVAQQSSTGTAATGFTANGPTNTVHADSTFTGNVGATAYTISDIVKHLKTIGLIAS